MRSLPACSTVRPLCVLVVLALLPLQSPCRAEASDLRRTAIVKAVEAARDSVVNIHGQKTLGADDASLRSDSPRKVNGMGTGVVIDERGYILTNYHVVDGVRKIEVTLADKSTYIAQLVSSDPVTDLAVIKINASRKLPPMTAGTSDDLMIGEPVIAMGNAFGYEHTVTRGIISALHRSVQVSDAQSYEDLIQTDASINPGNSGGPLMNIDGQMIGLNVAVRAGAQGIGFAIPIDKAMTIAGELLSVARLENRWHGIVARPGRGPADGMVVHSVERDSPAARAGIKPGDVVKSVNGKDVVRALDFERALIGERADEFEVHVVRDREPLDVSLALATRPRSLAPQNDQVWDMLGLRLAPVPTPQFKQYNSRYRGGLAIVAVRAEGPAAKQGIRRGDVLVGMHEWETVTPENVDYILNRPDFQKFDPVKFYILRSNDSGSEVLYGHLAVSGTAREQR
jgi:serine protease Do